LLAAVLAAAASVALTGCVTQPEPAPVSGSEGTHPSPTTPATPSDNQGEPVPGTTASPPLARSITHAGNGDFRFTGTGELADHPVRVWYNSPSATPATARILIVMTGTQRDGEAYRSDWVPLVKGRNTLVIVPEFSEKEFPGTSGYNLGGMVNSHDKVQPQDDWSFNLIEALFDYVVADVGSTATGYELFGHSAGAQFVHRFIEFMPNTRATIAIAANAGWYTVLDESVKFPYGLKDAPIGLDQMKPALSRKLVIMLGADDIDPQDSSLQRDEHTDEQGKNRLSRGLNFYHTAREAVGDSTPFNWRLVVVPGVAHDHRGMAEAALPLLYPAER
jgi:poly(3-hydroxybutyrate) depolymerase